MNRNVEIYTCYKRPEKNGFYEVEDNTRITEQGGYIPPEIQITQFMVAGKRLAEYRKEMYDFGFDEVVDEDFNDPTRSNGFDMSDASAIKKVMDKKRKRMEEKKKIDEIKKRDDEKQNKLDIEKSENG